MSKLMTEQEIWAAAFVATIEGLTASGALIGDADNLFKYSAGVVTEGAATVADAAIAEFRKKSFDPAGNML